MNAVANNIISRIGLGCSRLGSFGAAGGSDPCEVVRIAQDGGIKFFDTADIYGKGESERILARQLDATAAPVLITKAGQYFPFYLQMLSPARALAMIIARHNKDFRSLIVASRGRSLPTNFSPDRITRCLHASRSRLSPFNIDIFMLHGPSADVIQNSLLQRSLQRLIDAGFVRRIGASCEDIDAAAAAAKSAVFTALQLPISIDDRRFVEVACDARASGKLVIAREVLGGPRIAGNSIIPQMEVVERVAAPIDNNWADIVLIGTTHAERLRILLNCLRTRGI